MTTRAGEQGTSAGQPGVVRFGVLAASRIAASALIEPGREVAGVEVTVVSARDLDRARAAARQWGIPSAVGSYRELIDRDDVDAVYIGTPAALHRPWAIAAIEAGKHVLVEKPLAANAEDARAIAAVADAAAASGVVVMEGYHWRYHPFAETIRQVIDSGVLGELAHVSAAFELPHGRIAPADIRWDLELGGGAMMDLGCYPIQWVRFAVGADPIVVSARAECPRRGVDGALRAELMWPSNVRGWVSASMIATADDPSNWLRVEGTAGTLVANNPLAPQRGDATLVVEAVGGDHHYEIEPTPTYRHQLRAFRDAVVDGTPFPTTVADGVVTMELIDACYLAAGLDPRPSQP